MAIWLLEYMDAASQPINQPVVYDPATVFVLLKKHSPGFWEYVSSERCQCSSILGSSQAPRGL